MDEHLQYKVILDGAPIDPYKFMKVASAIESPGTISEKR